LQQQLAVRRRPLALFGGGHVGHALVRALLPLPFQTRWVDSRETVFPTDLPAHVVVDASDPVEAAVADLAPGSFVLIMSFSHAEDLEVLRKCLERQAQRGDLPFIGLIGSRTKWAVFQRRLLARGLPQALLDQVTCPIGLPGIEGKQPAVIAASVVAQLLLQAVRPMPHEDFEK
jgi:xanthine dehydrogenase accessory factor